MTDGVIGRSSADADSLVSPGREVGGYRIEYKLGAGGMGAVYAAVEPTIGRRVAVKVLRAELSADKGHALRFEREARSVSLVRHPAIIDIFSFGKLEDGRPFFVMPLLDGRTLREVIAAAGKLPPPEAWRLARDIAEGLVAAHTAGVLHRDLKPDNVFVADVVGRKSQPVLLDFGLAKWTDVALDDSGPEDRIKLTGTGVPLGTPLYMAPEQWWSSPACAATDQYAFGVMLFEMMVGRPPFFSQKFPELLQQHLHEKPPTLASRDVVVPSAVEDLLARLLEKDPKDRFRDFAQVIELGDRAFAGAPTISRNTDQATVDEAKPAAQPPALPPKAQKLLDTPLADAASARSAPQVSAVQLTSPAQLAVGASQQLGWAPVVAYLTMIVLCGGGLFAVGYTGEFSRDVVGWFMISGFGGPAAVFVAAIAMAVLPRLAPRIALRPELGVGALALALLPAAAGAFASYSGWQMVTSGVDNMNDVGARFQILHIGRYEVGAGDFMGMGLASALTLGLAATLGVTDTQGLRRLLRSPWAWAAIGLAIAVFPLASKNLLSPLFSLLVGAATLLLLASVVHRPSPAAREIAIASLAAALCGRAVSQDRADVVAATAFITSPTRAERVEAIVHASQDRLATSLTTTVVLALVAAAALHSLLRARAAGLLQGPLRSAEPSGLGRRAWALAAVQIVLVGALFSISTHVQQDYASRRASTAALVSEQLVLFAQLSPPSAEGAELPPPVTSPALQITPDTVALNGKGIGKLSALDAESGRQAITAMIVAALATPSPQLERSVDLSLLVDRNVPWRRVEHLIGIAFDAGARSVDILLTRGAAPIIPKGAPAEASHLLPRDFGALALVLGREGFESKPDDNFDKVASILLTVHQQSPADPIPVRIRASGAAIAK